MKINIGNNIKVELSTIIRLEWRTYLPVLIVAERFENYVKWILRIIAIIGIATSVISIDSKLCSLGLTLLIVAVEQFFERTVFEYTTLALIPPPDFEIDTSQWEVNAFMIPEIKTETDYCFIGPTYTDKDYAVNFFNYLKTWDTSRKDDNRSNIILSFIYEPNNKYTTYIYPNLGKQNLDKYFKQIEIANRLEKYGKQQQKLIMHYLFWKTLPLTENSFVKVFIDFIKPNEKFVFTPSYLDKKNKDKVEFIFSSQIIMFDYKHKNRKDLTKNDIEFYYPAHD
jgi:hypothetical protein